MNRLFKASLRPVRNLSLTVIVNVLVCAFLHSRFEPDAPGRLGELYWAVTTATTTGYGDISPETLGGRIVAMWLMVSSLMLFAVATGQIAANIIQDPHIFDHDEQEEVKDDLDDTVVMLIELLRFHKIPIPASVEEAQTEGSTNGTHS